MIEEITKVGPGYRKIPSSFNRFQIASLSTYEVKIWIKIIFKLNVKECQRLIISVPNIIWSPIF